MNKTTTEVLQELHRNVSVRLLENLLDINKPARASMIEVARKFLQDNGIKVDTSYEAIEGLITVTKLPFQETVDEIISKASNG